MKPLTLEALQEVIARQTATVEFPGHDVCVTVRQMTAEETKRVQDSIKGRDETSDMTQADVEVMIASIAITSADFDSDEGRDKLAKLPRAMMHTIANAVYGLSGADGSTKKN